MSDPYISIIIPTTNRHSYIIQSFRSLLNDENFTKYQVIIVNDSDEELPQEIEAEFQRFSNVLVVKSLERSASGARSDGVAYAKGKYITFLDDDDFLGPNRLKEMLELLESWDPGQYSFISTYRTVINRTMSYIQTPKGQIKGSVNLSDLLYFNDIDIGILLSTELYHEVGGFDRNLKGLEDWDLIIRLCLKAPGYKIGSIKYFVVDDAMEGRVSSDQERARLQIAEKYKDTFGDKWYGRFMAIALYLDRKLDLKTAFKLSYKAQNYAPLWLFSKLKIKMALSK